jgi:glutaredoxin
MKPKLYIIDGCVSCFRAKQHLINIKIAFKEINLFTQAGAASELKKLNGEIITPFFFDGFNKVHGDEILKIRKN